ncbi:hypothetical protein BH11MYX2_BH11MYX2_32180 [soil metagenome]
MKRGMAWFVVGTLAMIGGPSFCLRAAGTLGAASGSTTLWIAFAIGAALASAVVMRVSAISPWGRTAAKVPIICAAIASAFVLSITFVGHGASGGFAYSSHSVLAIAGACAVGAAALVAMLLQRDRSPTSKFDVILLSLVLTFAYPALLFAIPVFAPRRAGLGAFETIVTLGSIVVVGFVTQAMLTVRQPWTSAAGPLVLSLLLIQGQFVGAASSKPLSYKFGFYIGAVTLLWLIGRIGSGIACRVYADRFATVIPDLPSAHVE